jgi:2-polyprenyl-3-methyl-5-hydroxy-6-metoxy-1,4-benzoquinol methylase
MVSLISCPICGSDDLSLYSKCIDYTVSHETFEIRECENCKLKLTSPRPSDNQLGKYYLSDDYVSHSNESKSLVDRIYNLSKQFTLSWKFRLVKENASVSTPRLLDYGCGTGAFLTKCINKGFDSTGLEPSSKARKIAVQNTGLQIVESIADLTESYDVITLWHVIEHIPDLNEILQSLKGKLKKNGIIFIAVPNPNSYDAEYYGEHWAGFDVPRHLWHFSKESMTRLLIKNNLQVKRIIPMKLDAYYVSILSEKYRKRGIPGSLIFGTLQGWISNLKAGKNNHSSLIYIAVTK